MLNKVKAYIEQHQLLQVGKRYLVALSGGADSVCLLLLLRELGYQTDAVHCNFHLRGEESNRDEDFVKSLCEDQHVELHVIHFDTETYASVHHVSIEMAARELRYRYFEQLRKDIGAEGVCVAHHQNDSVETILMNLIRGTGIHGLTGIKPRNGHILRPLLCVSRHEIETWLNGRHQSYVTDSTNLEAHVTRNKLRLNVIPQLLDITPSAGRNILQTAAYLSEAASVYDHAIKAALQRLCQDHCIAVDQLMNEPSPKSILHEWLSPIGFSSTVVEEIYRSLGNPHSGKLWTSSSHQLTICQGLLMAEPLTEALPTLRIPEDGTYVYNENMRLRIEMKPGRHIDTDKQTACLDASTVHFPLTLRPVTRGDRFQPFGMTGTKLVSDYLTDRKVSLFDKRRTLVLCDRDNQILWLVGHRPDGRFCVNAHTQTTALITLFMFF